MFQFMKSNDSLKKKPIEFDGSILLPILDTLNTFFQHFSYLMFAIKFVHLIIILSSR